MRTLALLWFCFSAFLGFRVAADDYDMKNHLAGAVSVEAMKGGVAKMPCDLRPPSPADAVQLVLWYRYGSTKPIYSYDVRTAAGGHYDPWGPDELILRGRGRFNPSDVRTAFQIDSVEEADEGLYRCRVDFKLSPTRNSVVNLTLIVPPGVPRILDNRGGEVESIIGPFNEGDDLFMTCESSGGKPAPEVRWFRDGDPPALIDDQSQAISGGAVRNDLRIHHLGRHHLRSKFICEATNNRFTQPSRRLVEIDMNFRPLDVEITSKGQTLSAGKEYEVICQAVGSRPPARITWWKSGIRLVHSRDMPSSDDGNLTTGTLLLSPMPSDNGRNLVCQADNPSIPGSTIEDTWPLVVHYVPIATLRFGKSLVTASVEEGIEEGKDVYFECSIEAVPPSYKVQWRHNGKPLQHNVNEGIILSNLSLVLQRVKRSLAGAYTCVGFNKEGEGESLPLQLKIKYPPVCKDEERPIVYGVAKMEEAFVTCRVEAEPPPTRFRWAFNNSATTLEIQAKNYNSTGLASTVRYRPQNELDYGSLLCWASNELGSQVYPCVYHVIAVGVPEPPLDCTIVNLTTESIQVTCREGFNGGLKQQFVLEVYEEERRQLWANVSNTKPSFVINGLSPGTTVSLSVYSVNAKGQSEKVFLDASTQKNAGQVLARPDSLMRSLTLNSLLPVLVGVASGLALVAIVIVIMMKMKGHSSRSRRGRRRSRGSDDNKPVAPGIPVYNPVEGLMKSDDPYELDEKNPDLIPQGSVTLECPGRPLQVEMLNHKERRHVSFCEHHTFLPSCSNEYLPNASSPSPNHIWLKNPEEGGISSTAASASAFMSLPRNYTSTPLLQRPDPVVAYATLDRTPRIPPPRGFGNHPDDPHPPKRRGSDQVESTV